MPDWELLEWDATAVTGVSTAFGDIVVDDIDGVAVLPPSISEDVLR